MKTYIKSIWFWWILTTALYVIPQSLHASSFITRIVGFIGLFVPYGLLSMISLAIAPIFSFLSIAFFIVAMILVEKYLNKKNYSLFTRILLNLLALFIITMIVDVIRLSPLGSFYIFKDWSIHQGF